MADSFTEQVKYRAAELKSLFYRGSKAIKHAWQEGVHKLKNVRKK